MSCGELCCMLMVEADDVGSNWRLLNVLQMLSGVLERHRSRRDPGVEPVCELLCCDNV